jgi:hypothetical protein
VIVMATGTTNGTSECNATGEATFVLHGTYLQQSTTLNAIWIAPEF